MPPKTAARSRPGASRTLSTSAIAENTSVGSVSGLRSTKYTPSGNRASCLEAVSSASRVFPVPPGPVSVSSRVSPRSRSMSPIAPLGRRTRFVADARLSCGPPASATPGSRRSGHRSRGRAVAPDARGPSGRATRDLGTSRRRACRPRRGRWWPPISRSGHRALPPRSELPGSRRSRRSCRRPEHPRRCAVPCGPGSGAVGPGMRRERSLPCDGGSQRARRRRDATNNESPSVPISTPPCSATAVRTISLCRSSWRTNPSRPRSCSTRVDPSMSVNRNVTVPVGRSRILRTVRERPRGRSLPAIGPRTTNLRGALMRASTSDGPLARRKKGSDQTTRDH